MACENLPWQRKQGAKKWVQGACSLILNLPQRHASCSLRFGVLEIKPAWCPELMSSSNSAWKEMCSWSRAVKGLDWTTLILNALGCFMTYLDSLGKLAFCLFLSWRSAGMHFSMLVARGQWQFTPAEKTQLCSSNDQLQLKTFLQVSSLWDAGVANALFVLLHSTPQKFLWQNKIR